MEFLTALQSFMLVAFGYILPLRKQKHVLTSPSATALAVPLESGTQQTLCLASTPVTSTVTQTLEFFGSKSTWASTVTNTYTSTVARSCPITTITSASQPSGTCTLDTQTCVAINCLRLETVTAGCSTSKVDPCCPAGTSTVYAVSVVARNGWIFANEDSVPLLAQRAVRLLQFMCLVLSLHPRRRFEIDGLRDSFGDPGELLLENNSFYCRVCK
jgi:hypothetical protein